MEEDRTFAEFFCGIGLMRMGLERVGWRVRFANAFDEIPADESGDPILEPRSYLLDCDLPPGEVQCRHPALWRYLQDGEPEVAGRHLCRKRCPWYV